MYADVTAERTMLACLLQEGPTAIAEVAWLPESDLYSPHSAALLRSMRFVAATDRDGFGPASVAEALTNEGVRFPNGQSPMGVVAALWTDASAVRGQSTYYAERIAKLARRRLVHQRSARIQHMLESDDERSLEAVEGEIQRMLADSQMPTSTTVDGLFKVHDFINGGDAAIDWVVPGLIGAQERHIVIAPEKAGKSVLARQIAHAVACGYHPLIGPSLPIPAKPSLVIDLENPTALLRKEFARLAPMGGRLWQGGDTPYWLWHQPGGINLSDPKDRAKIRTVVEMVRPAFVSLGPAYKTSGPPLSWEEQARSLMDMVDELRVTSNATFWIEHHAPVETHNGVRQLRPIGGGSWLRWPDFLLRLVPTQDDPPFPTLHWQVALSRDEGRDWPTTVNRNEALPWIGTWMQGIPPHLRVS